MTREEAYQKFSEWCNLGFGHSTMPGSEVLVMAMKSLRPTTREQVEKMRGEWQWQGPCRDNQALRSEVVIVQENDDYDSRARLWERQLEDSIKAGVHKAKVETKRKARVNALATNVLSDAARQQAALKVQQDFFGGGYR